MKEIIWLGRGGQGAFTAAKLLGAAFASRDENSFSLAFPSFGPERRGAPVKAFTKLDDKAVLDRSETEKADYIVILDETLYNNNLHKLLKVSGKILVNSTILKGENVISFDGNSLARELKIPTVNTVMLGAIGEISHLVTKDNILQAIRDYMPQKLHDKNIIAVEKAAEEVRK